MDDYIEETPEEREAGRKFMRDAPAMVKAFLATESREEAEAIIKAFAEANKGG